MNTKSVLKWKFKSKAHGMYVGFTLTHLPFHIVLFRHITQIKMNHDYSYKFMCAPRIQWETLYSPKE